MAVTIQDILNPEVIAQTLARVKARMLARVKARLTPNTAADKVVPSRKGGGSDTVSDDLVEAILKITAKYGLQVLSCGCDENLYENRKSFKLFAHLCDDQMRPDTVVAPVVDSGYDGVQPDAVAFREVH